VFPRVKPLAQPRYHNLAFQNHTLEGPFFLRFLAVYNELNDRNPHLRLVRSTGRHNPATCFKIRPGLVFRPVRGTTFTVNFVLMNLFSAIDSESGIAPVNTSFNRSISSHD